MEVVGSVAQPWMEAYGFEEDVLIKNPKKWCFWKDNIEKIRKPDSSLKIARKVREDYIKSV